MRTILFLLSFLLFSLAINGSAQNLTIIFPDGNLPPKALYGGKQCNAQFQPGCEQIIDTITIDRGNISSPDHILLVHHHITDNGSDTIQFAFAAGIGRLQVVLNQGRFPVLSASRGVTFPTLGAFGFPLEIHYGGAQLFIVGINSAPLTPLIPATHITDGKGLTQFNFLFEEDFLLGMFGLGGLNYDRDYTGGFAFIFHGSVARKAFIISPAHHFLDKVCFQRLYTSDQYDFSSYSSNLKLGGSAFSPFGDKLRETAPVIGDRPYASLVYIGQSNTYLSKNDKNAITSDFVFGMLGLHIMDELQTSIHRWNKNNFKSFTKESDPLNNTRPYYPMGWHNQISEGGEPTLLYALTARQLKKRLPSFYTHPRDTANVFLLDLVQMESVNIGYYNNLRYGWTFRFGKIRSHWSSFSSAPISNIQAQGLDTTKGISEVKPIKRYPQYYFFAGSRINIVVYNALMEGQIKHSIYTLDDTQIKHVIFEGEVGFYLQPCKHSGFTFTLAGRTADFKTTTINKSHLWASVYYTWYLGS